MTSKPRFSVSVVLNYKSDFIPPRLVLQRLPFVTGIKFKLSLEDPMCDVAGPSTFLVTPCDSPLCCHSPQPGGPPFPTQAPRDGFGRLRTALRPGLLFPQHSAELVGSLAPDLTPRFSWTTPTGAYHHQPWVFPNPILFLVTFTFKQNEIICYFMCSFFRLSTALSPALHMVPGTYRFCV